MLQEQVRGKDFILESCVQVRVRAGIYYCVAHAWMRGCALVHAKFNIFEYSCTSPFQRELISEITMQIFVCLLRCTSA